MARACGRPVKYVEDRLDNMTSCDNYGPDRIYELELGLERDGAMLAFGMKVIDDYGAYLQFGVSGEDLYVTPADLDAYFDAIIGFWRRLSTAVLPDK